MHGEQLENILNTASCKFVSSWLIGMCDLRRGVEIIRNFSQRHLLVGKYTQHPDFMVIENADSKRIITIDQIRNLQKFLYYSSPISGNKICVVVGAELMNINAANCCLKILEDTPDRSYIFLLSSNLSRIPVTIRSRCRIIRIRDAETNDILYNDVLKVLCDPESLFQFVDVVLQTSGWQSFIDAILLLSSRIRKWLVYSFALDGLENIYIPKWKDVDMSLVIEKLDAVYGMIVDTDAFTLDRKHMAILIMDSILKLDA